MEANYHSIKFSQGILFICVFILFQQISFSQPGLLDPTAHPKFVNTLPVINDLGLRVDMTKGGNISVKMVEIKQDLGLSIAGYTGSKVWAYDFPNLPATYPGATIVAQKNKPIQIKWENALPSTGHFLPVDASVHIAHPHNLHMVSDIRDWYAAGNVPVVAHLHGGHTESESDGLPESWFTQGFAEKGHTFVKEDYLYDNDQPAATLWYHDHALGITRLNAYAGLAGFYFIRDNEEEKLIKKNIIPGGNYEIEIAIQDKMFKSDGELFWPANPGDPMYDEFINEEGAILPQEDFPGGGPTIMPEFFGDFILVNGKAWPKLEVEPRKYRLRLLNGSDSRFYVLEFRDAQTGGTTQGFLQIGSEAGLFEKPVAMTQLLIAPGERMDVVVDFSALNGKQIYLRNLGPDEPYGGGIPGVDFIPADEMTTGQIMMFDVAKQFNRSIANASITESTDLGIKIKPLKQKGATRQLALFEGKDQYGRLMPILGTLAEGSLTYSDAVTENPMLNDVEVWEVYNATMDAHPIHLHLVSFQVINREIFYGTVADKTQTAHNGSEITGGLLTVSGLGGNARGPEKNEKGWKDTAVMLPGEVTRVIAKFDRSGMYVWHCHILSHEEHEMMRPFHVGPMPMHKQSGDALAVTEFKLDQNYPNPFNPNTVIKFSVPGENSMVSLKVYNSMGEEVGTLINTVVPGGNHEVQFDASGLSSGVYFYTFKAGNFVDSKKMMLVK